MGQCQSCGEPASFLRPECRSCRDLRIEDEREEANQALLLEQRKTQIPGEVAELFGGFLSGERPEAEAKKLPALVRDAIGEDYDKNSNRQLVVESACDAIEALLAADVLTDESEKRIELLFDAINLEPHEFDGTPAQDRLAKAVTLKRLSSGTITPFSVPKQFPVRFKRDELPVWVFEDVTFSKFRTKTVYQSGRQGFSFRIAKGVHYRVGATKGEAVRQDYLDEQGTGLLAITDQALYFVSPTKSTRIPHDKIIPIEPDESGLSITEDRSNARPSYFEIDDANFAAALLHGLVNREEDDDE